MSCLALEQLAAATDGPIPEHVSTCERCAALLEEQRSIRALAQALPPVRLSSDRRAALAAEVMAQADVEVPRRSWRVAIAAVSAIAVTAMIVVATRDRSSDAVPNVPVADRHEIRVSSRSASVEGVPPAEAIATLRATGADLSRDTTAERDVITLRAGNVAVDASATRPVQIVSGATRVAVIRSRASVTARAGVIDHVAVFAGSVEVIDGGKRHVIVAGETWDRLPEPPAVVQPAASLAAFREGWTQLRGGNLAVAIAAFDRATDPVVAEDAAYWAAVAAERLGHADEARRRFGELIAKFPSSLRLDAARAALDRLK
jgi:hypothetical protein